MMDSGRSSAQTCPDTPTHAHSVNHEIMSHNSVSLQSDRLTSHTGKSCSVFYWLKPPNRCLVTAGQSERLIIIITTKYKLKHTLLSRLILGTNCPNTPKLDYAKLQSKRSQFNASSFTCSCRFVIAHYFRHFFSGLYILKYSA